MMFLVIGSDWRRTAPIGGQALLRWAAESLSIWRSAAWALLPLGASGGLASILAGPGRRGGRAACWLPQAYGPLACQCQQVETSQSSGSPSVVHGSAASAPLRNLVEFHILRPHPKPSGVGIQQSPHKLSRWFWCMLQFGNPCFQGGGRGITLTVDSDTPKFESWHCHLSGSCSSSRFFFFISPPPNAVWVRCLSMHTTCHRTSHILVPAFHMFVLSMGQNFCHADCWFSRVLDT